MELAHVGRLRLAGVPVLFIGVSRLDVLGIHVHNELETSHNER